MSSCSGYEPVLYRYTLPGPALSLGVRLLWGPGWLPMWHSLVSATAKSNGTIVPKSLVLAPYPTAQIRFLEARSSHSVGFFPVFRPSTGVKCLDAFLPEIGLLAERLDTLPGVSIALGIIITFGRRSSVAERGSHNP